MKREEAKTVLYEWQKSMVEHGVPIDTSKVQALRVAIEALSKPNYESDTEVMLAVTDRNKDKVVLWDAFGEVKYYPHGEINCVKCPHYYETEDDTGVHSHCGSHGRLIDAGALEKELSKRWDISDDQDFCNKEVWDALRNAPTVQADRPHGEWVDKQTYNQEIDTYVSWIECSVCGCAPYYGLDSQYNFCPNCGADMRKGKE